MSYCPQCGRSSLDHNDFACDFRYDNQSGKWQFIISEEDRRAFEEDFEKFVDLYEQKVKGE